MSFKKMRSINLPEDEQGYIFYLCRTYRRRPESIQKDIENLCKELGGTEYHCALLQVITTAKSVRRISIEQHVSESVLYDLRKKFYERYEKILKATE